jgi:hypothetical protein
MNDVARIAKGLTEAQRTALKNCPCDAMGAGLFVALYTSGLVDLTDDDECVLTPLGLAIRRYLEENPGA